MNFEFEERASASSFVQTLWRTHSEQKGTFISRAESHCELVFTQSQGNTSLTVRGPETRATLADCPGEAEFFGI